MTDAPIKITAGRPSDALQRNRIGSWSYGNLVPRHNYTNYKAREGRTNLETLRLIRDRDPDAAQAVSNFQLLLSPGYHSEARNGDEIDEQAQAYLSDLDARVGSEYGGGMDGLIDVLTLTLITQGAIALEIQISDGLDAVLDFHPIDPARITAKRERDTQRLMWGMQVGRGVEGSDAEGFIEFNPRQFRYMPLHPDVDDPYGRSPIFAALTAIFFKIQVLEDLRAVVHNQGYPRLDVKILEEVITNNLPPGTSAVQRKELMDGLQVSLQASFAALNPDDAIIHPSSVEAGYLVPGGTMIDIAALDAILDKQIISGLKQLPILLGRNEGATTTHATVQFRVFALLVESMQRKIKRMIEWAHTTALQVAGYQATAHVRFDELVTNDRLIDAQALETEARAWKALIDSGWADGDEAAQAILNHPMPVVEGEDVSTTRTTTPFLGYHIDAGVVSRNEAREQLGLAPEDESESERLRRLQTLFAVGQAAINMGIPLETTLELIGLQVTLPEPTPEPSDDTRRIPTTRAAPDEQAKLEREFKATVAALFQRLIDDYPVTAIDPDTDIESIVAEWFTSNGGKAWSQDLQDALTDHYTRAFNIRGRLALGELGIVGAFDLKNPEMLQALQDLGAERVTGINDETRNRIVTQLVEGSEAGESVADLGRRLRTLFDDMSVQRSELIAVTETATAFSIASQESYQRNGIEKKAWLTTNDDKTTDGCLDNQGAGEIAVDADFPSGDPYPPRFPGCRCTIVPIVDGYTPPNAPWKGE